MGNIQTAKFTTNDALLHWKFEKMPAPFTDITIPNELMQHMLHCAPITTKSLYIIGGTTTEKMFKVIASVWLSIMHNYSYSISTNQLCENGKVVASLIKDADENGIKLIDSIYTGVYPQ